MSARRAIAALTVLGAVGLWAGLAAWRDSPALPGPLAVAREGIHMLGSGVLLADLGASLSRVVVGYLLAAVAGVGLGAAASLGGRWTVGLRTLADLLRPVPPIAWVPLAILWLGLGDPSARFIVFIGAFFPIFVQTCWALDRCPPAWLELARSLGASRGLTLWRVRLPAAAPGIAAGLRTGLGLAWTSVIAAELVGAQSGLGYRIQTLRIMLVTEGVIVGMVTIGLTGLAMDRAARVLERRWS
jgi:ABC-type nitrate/sulfonate/bicarbonate transport system permease component